MSEVNDWVNTGDEPATESAPVVEEPAAEPVGEPVAEQPKAPKRATAVKKERTDVIHKRGDAGDHVKKMQEYLNSIGLSCPTNGRFCAATETALKAAQKQSGLEESGKLDEATCASMCK